MNADKENNRDCKDVIFARQALQTLQRRLMGLRSRARHIYLGTMYHSEYTKRPPAANSQVINQSVHHLFFNEFSETSARSKHARKAM